MSHRQMDSLTRLLVQLLEIGKTESANVELAQRGLSDREACDSEVVDAVASAVQESCAVQIGKKAVHGADRQPRETCYLLCGQSARRFAEELQKTQPALQCRDVVTPFWMVDHEGT